MLCRLRQIGLSQPGYLVASATFKNRRFKFVGSNFPCLRVITVTHTRTRAQRGGTLRFMHNSSDLLAGDKPDDVVVVRSQLTSRNSPHSKFKAKG